MSDNLTGCQHCMVAIKTNDTTCCQCGKAVKTTEQYNKVMDENPLTNAYKEIGRKRAEEHESKTERHQRKLCSIIFYVAALASAVVITMIGKGELW